MMENRFHNLSPTNHKQHEKHSAQPQLNKPQTTTQTQKATQKTTLKNAKTTFLLISDNSLKKLTAEVIEENVYSYDGQVIFAENMYIGMGIIVCLKLRIL
jgi:hypothetical protein